MSSTTAEYALVNYGKSQVISVTFKDTKSRQHFEKYTRLQQYDERCNHE